MLDQSCHQFLIAARLLEQALVKLLFLAVAMKSPDILVHSQVGTLLGYKASLEMKHP
jgi:hypothetical protein